MLVAFQLLAKHAVPSPNQQIADFAHGISHGFGFTQRGLLGALLDAVGRQHDNHTAERKQTTTVKSDHESPTQDALAVNGVKGRYFPIALLDIGKRSQANVGLFAFNLHVKHSGDVISKGVPCLFREFDDR